MIPNIFISSTISDLHYLRDALRDAVDDLSYNPIMSNHGEVGYLYPTTAAESCYHSVKQCHMAVLIIGKHYGELTGDGISVTHKEFHTAQENGVPLIAFVEAQVLSYKDVFDSNPSPDTWRNFSQMDNPEKTFSLINEIINSKSYNGLIAFTSAAEAKKKLKLQIADFVGESLSELIRPVKSEVQEVLAEVKTLRRELSENFKQGEKSFEQKSAYLKAMKFFLDDRHRHYRKFAEELCGDIDTAVPLLMAAKTFEDFVVSAGGSITLNDDLDTFRPFFQDDDSKRRRMIAVTMSHDGHYAIDHNKHVMLSESKRDNFAAIHETLVRLLAQ